MTLLDLIISTTPTFVILIVIFLCRNLIVTRLKESVQFEFNEKLEFLKNDLKAKEDEINALRSGALSSMTSRQIALDKRRLEAVDQLWSAVLELNKSRPFITMMANIDYQRSLELTHKDPKAREAFKAFSLGFDFSKMDILSAAKARPFLSPMAWANYGAMLSIITHATARFELLKGGIGKDLMNDDAFVKLLKTALPHHTNHPSNVDASIYYGLMELLDEQLLNEIQVMLSGADTDRDNVLKAKKIVELTNEVKHQAAVAEVNINTKNG